MHLLDVDRKCRVGVMDVQQCYINKTGIIFLCFIEVTLVLQARFVIARAKSTTKLLAVKYCII